MPTSARCVSLRSTLGQVREAELYPSISLSVCLLWSVRIHLAAVLSGQTSGQLLGLLAWLVFTSACV